MTGAREVAIGCVLNQFKQWCWIPCYWYLAFETLPLKYQTVYIDGLLECCTYRPSPSCKCNKLIMVQLKMTTLTEIRPALKILFMNIYMFIIGQQHICEANCYSV